MSWTQQNVRLQSSINSVGIHCCMEILPMLMSSLTGEMVDLLFTALSSFSLSSPTSSGMWGMPTSLPRACCKFRLQKDSLTTTHIVLSIQRTDFLPTIKIMFQGIPGLPKQYLNNWNVFFLSLYCKSLILFELPRYKYYLDISLSKFAYRQYKDIKSLYWCIGNTCNHARLPCSVWRLCWIPSVERRLSW